MERSRLWLRRGAVFVTTCLALTVAVPLGQKTPAEGSRFPLAGLWELLTTKPSWALERPTVPIQMSGDDGDRPARVSSDATRAGEGVGRPLDPIGAGLRPHEPLGRPKAGEWTTPKAINGFDPATSRLVQAGTGSDYELYENADGSFTRRIHTRPVNYRAADGRWVPIDTRLIKSPEGRWQTAANSMQVSFAAAPAAQSWGGGPVTDPAAEGTASGDLAKVAFPSGALLAYQLSNARLAAPRIDGPAATYADALPATDLTLVAVGTGIEARLLLKDRTAANSWVFPLRLQGLTPRPCRTARSRWWTRPVAWR